MFFYPQFFINNFFNAVIVNNLSSCSSTIVEQQITSQSATSTLTYNSPFGIFLHSS